MKNIETSDILNLDIDITTYPLIVQDIANIIGLADTIKLLHHYIGTRMYVPRKFRSEHILHKLIGEVSASLLIDTYGGDTLEIPKCNSALRSVRNAQIINSNQSESQLSREWNLTVRQISFIKNKV